MKRIAIFCIIIISIISIIGLSQTAINPESFSGEWYASGDQRVFLFQNGLIYSPKNAVISSDAGAVSGAYTYCSDSVFLFTEGVQGLETEKQLYLVHQDVSSFLCDNKDGTGKIYFIRQRK